ncbi:hypothetical protein [Sphingorhabdus sp. Alg239-R122]|uniref:hypothetical protein n=1 Tax=Sphingorhabdus sp. Alg239-R122 TaxID=2305989 RepID=UPI0013DD8380|nr:hypothetical protein [Sphingorhabdus sp. Alg239-R122]
MGKSASIKKVDMSAARELRIKSAIPQFAVLSEELRDQASRLDADELAVLGEIKNKLNEGLSADLAAKADTVGGFVW